MPRPASPRKSQPARRSRSVPVKKAAKKRVATVTAKSAKPPRANGAVRTESRPAPPEARGGSDRRSERVLHAGRSATVESPVL